MLPELITILIGKRRESATEVQDVLTEFGCIILTRIGFHEAIDICSEAGLIILQVKGKKSEIDMMLKKLNRIKKVKAKPLVLTFDE